MKVKLFWMMSPVRPTPLFGTHDDSRDNAVLLEQKMNAWLEQHPDIKIVEIKHSATGGSWGPILWSFSVWYEEGTS